MKFNLSSILICFLLLFSSVSFADCRDELQGADADAEAAYYQNIDYSNYYKNYSQTANITENAASGAAPIAQEVSISKKATKAIETLPHEITGNLQYWIELVQRDGLNEVRKIKGYHDEPCMSTALQGVRSVRLNRGYRLYYTVDESVSSRPITVINVDLHEY